jgi:hypothetical protein
LVRVSHVCDIINKWETVVGAAVHIRRDPGEERARTLRCVNWTSTSLQWLAGNWTHLEVVSPKAGGRLDPLLPSLLDLPISEWLSAFTCPPTTN